MAKTTRNYYKVEELPLVMKPDQVADLLGLSRNLAYKIIRENGLGIRLGEKRIVVPRDRLMSYLEAAGL